MMILNELRKHGRLAAKRHPMYEKNKVAKILGYVMAAFWAAVAGVAAVLALSRSVSQIWFPTENHIM